MAFRNSKNKREKKKYPKIGKKSVHSDFEYNTYKAMTGLVPPKACIEYEPDSLEYTVTKNYIPDFKITLWDDRVIYIETKGFFKYEDRVKMENVLAQHPDLDIRMVFQKDQPSCLGKGSKTRPSDWCTQRGIKFAIGEIPSDWFIEE